MPCGLMEAIPPSVPAVTRTPARCTRPTAASTLGPCQIETLEEGQLSRGRKRIRRCADGGADCDAALGEGLQQAVSRTSSRENWQASRSVPAVVTPPLAMIFTTSTRCSARSLIAARSAAASCASPPSASNGHGCW
ncbi:MAG: hypothetical protein QOH09_4725 [Pseudonocardiales bacterium]|jgi:hypothetical protein|nr:hypothetical protein [Pseudonocardiales bacterium]